MSAILDSLQRKLDDRVQLSHQQADLLHRVHSNATPAASGRTPTISFKAVDEMLDQLPPARYALPNTRTGEVAFFEVAPYKGHNRIRRLYGAPRDWRRETMALRLQYFAALHILQDVPNSIKLFGETFKVCSKCGSPLSNGDSLAAKLGPDCRKAFARWI